MAKKKPDLLNNEYLLQKYNGGVKFIRPDSLTEEDQVSSHTIKDILALPNDVNLVNARGESAMMNDLAVIRSGMSSLKDCLGKHVSDVAKPETAHFVSGYQQQIIKQKKLAITEYDFIRKDDLVVNCLLVSLPWYSHDNSINGILNFSIVSGRDVTAISLMSLFNLGLLNQPFKHDVECNYVKLSRRETECLKLLVKGKKSKEIAAILKIAPRTIDYYFENCMNKYNVSTRYELISKYLQS
jgi:DNA-binding CsgD family transcriptional regulator